MASPSTETPSDPAAGTDQAATLRRWVAMLLRLSIGLSLLNAGLTSYLAPGNVRFAANGGYFGLERVLALLPYLSIAIGLALILGFLLTVSSIAAGFFTLAVPAITTVQVLIAATSGFTPSINPGWTSNPFQLMMMVNAAPELVALALLIWLSPLENHPVSIDTLIFGKRRASLPRPLPVKSPVD